MATLCGCPQSGILEGLDIVIGPLDGFYSWLHVGHVGRWVELFAQSNKEAARFRRDLVRRNALDGELSETLKRTR